MRSTLTIEDDTDQRVRKLAESEHCSYKEAVNLVLARGLEALSVAESPPRYSVRAFDAGFQPGIDLGKLNELADGELADGSGDEA
jgi:hypothetical protein